MIARRDALAGCLLGTAVGDALGLPYEGLSPRRAARLYGPPGRMRFLFGRGMVSDDTEHACLVAQSLLASAGDEEVFLRDLARRFRWWMLGLPAGAGRATLRAGVRLWLGVPPSRSGVYSAGNGPAMRAAILGAAVDDPGRLRVLVGASSRLTHTDPRAEAGALAVAIAARTARQTPRPDGERFLAAVAAALRSGELLDRIGRVVESVSRGEATAEFVRRIGLPKGVSGYVNDTVPAVLHAWLRHPTDFRSAVTEIIRCGGDADSTAALVGGLVGTAVGPSGIPEKWLGRLAEWPRSTAWMTRLAHALDGESPVAPPSLPVVPLVLRNAVFLAVVLAHGFYRLRPW